MMNRMAGCRYDADAVFKIDFFFRENSSGCNRLDFAVGTSDLAQNL